MDLLHSLPFDPEFAIGARNAVHSCLRIQPAEKVTLITDEACLEIGASLAAELQRSLLQHNSFVLERLAPRPLVDMPREVLEDMETSDVSIFAVKAQQNELRTRMQMTDVVNRPKDAARAHGQHRFPGNAGRDACRLRSGGPDQHSGLANGQQCQGDSSNQSVGDRYCGTFCARVEVVED